MDVQNLALCNKSNLNGSTKGWTLTPLDMFHEHTVHTVDHSGDGSNKHLLSNKQNKIMDVKKSPKHSTPSARRHST